VGRTLLSAAVVLDLDLALDLDLVRACALAFARWSDGRPRPSAKMSSELMGCRASHTALRHAISFAEGSQPDTAPNALRPPPPMAETQPRTVARDARTVAQTDIRQ
jgi:hypothetical protein